MKKKLIHIIISILITAPICYGASLTGAKIKSGPYETNWDSIKEHNGAPEWFLDGKFGIYTHWGPITKANEYRPDHAYGRDMYNEERKEYAYHLETYGSPMDVGYKDLIPMFQPVKFDAEEWADLFYEAGARFAGPVAMHHDNFAMWGSEVTRWNIERTFGRDTCAELEKAIRARGMKFLGSFHHGYSWRYYQDAYKYDAGIPGNEDLYLIPHTEEDSQHSELAAQFRKEWLAKLLEFINKYEPDFIWFDWGISALPEEPVLDFFTHYFNSAAEWDRDVLVTFKKNPKRAFPGDFTVLDHERGGELELSDEPWLNDTSIGPWFYNANFAEKTDPKTETLIELFVDLVSKNGCLLLNIPPSPLGEIPESGKRILKEFGAWMRVNGDCMYNTRPWVVAEEGNGEIQAKMQFESVMTAEDIRFTRSKDKKTLYAVVLDWPENGRMVVRTLAKDRIDLKDISNIRLLGGPENLNWKQTGEGLIVNLGSQAPTDHAHAIGITFSMQIPDLKL